ncbi:hypothetical protein [Geothrix sp. 21YS21S-2]|uniref:hypothetical protein n=1 Tax=Geothrix sp. 21YS21S-2 TaxID=3068893 RepID=UPI0027BA116F|nr:hypothetical protein [Geothrix sp. 21YS21S-2]
MDLGRPWAGGCSCHSGWRLVNKASAFEAYLGKSSPGLTVFDFSMRTTAFIIVMNIDNNPNAIIFDNRNWMTNGSLLRQLSISIAFIKIGVVTATMKTMLDAINLG